MSKDAEYRPVPTMPSNASTRSARTGDATGPLLVDPSAQIPQAAVTENRDDPVLGR